MRTASQATRPTNVTDHRADLRRLLPPAVKVLLLALVGWGIHRTVERAFAELERQHWSPATLDPAWLAAAAGLYLAGLFPSGWFWYRLLSALGQKPLPGRTLRAWYIGHLGKYVPGKALVVLMRAGMVRSSAVDAGVATVSIFYETFTGMAVAGLLAALMLAAVAWSHESGPWYVALACALGAVCAVPTLPGVFRLVGRRLARGRYGEAVLDRFGQLSLPFLASAWISIAGGWVLLGLSLWAMLRAAGSAEWPPSLEQLALCVAAASLSLVAGFLSFLPGGVGVREAVLFELLEPRFGPASALVAAVVARLVWLVAELVAASILYVSGTRRPPAQDGAGESEPPS